MRPQIGPDTTCERSSTVIAVERPSDHACAAAPSAQFRARLRSSVVVEEVDDRLGLVADHDLADRLHVGPPVGLGVDAGADGDELDEPLLRADAALGARRANCGDGSPGSPR